jgi:peptide/nickel transport system substrate-binding protein
VKKLTILLVILLVCVFVITGCGSDTATTTQPAVTTTAKPTTTAATTTAAATKPAATTTAAVTSSAVATPTSKTTTAPSKVKTGGTLRLISTSVPGTPIGWMQETVGGSTATMQLCMDFLLHEQLDGTLVPNIAESYELDAKVPSIVFKLKKGVKFADGSDLTASVIKWDLDTTGKGPPNAGQAAFWKSIEAIDDYTLKITFTSWQNRLLRSFADATTYLYSKAAYDKNGLEWMRWHMVGPGPFAQVDFQRDVVTKTVKNEYYFDKGKPYLDGVDMLYVVDELTRLALFKSGGADVADLAGNGRIAADLKNDGYTILSKLGSPTILVPDSVNADSPWSNLKVRQAAEYAIDRESMAKTFGFGYSSPAYQLPSPTTKAYDPKFVGRKFDIAKAKQLLTEAGYPNGFKTTMYAETARNPDIPVAIQAFLAKIGIQVNLEYQDAAKYTATYQGTWKNGLILNTLIEWPNYNNVFNFYFGATSPFFKSLKKPDGWTAAFTASMTSPLPDVDLQRKCINLIYDDDMVIPLYHGSSLYATQNYVRDTGFDTRSSIYWNNQLAWLDK